jgi:hypothetical protein
MGLTLSFHPLPAEGQVRYQDSPCGICGGRGGYGKVSVRVVGSSASITIPPILHIHSFVYH